MTLYKDDARGPRLGVYDSNGAPIGESAIGNNYLWQGRWYSWETGLYFFRARWYDPVVGRWMSKDRIGIAGGLNQYVFCNDNPVNGRDPLGLWNLWNRYTWGQRNGVGWSIWDSINPLHESAAWSGTGWGASQGAASALDGLNPFGNPLEFVYRDACGKVGKEFLASRIAAGVARLAYSARLSMAARAWAVDAVGASPWATMPLGRKVGMSLFARGELLRALLGTPLGSGVDLSWSASDLKGLWDIGSDIHGLFQ